MYIVVSVSLSAVCRHYLDRYPADVDLLWEVEGVGGPYQRTRVAFKLCSSLLNGKYVWFEQIHQFSFLVLFAVNSHNMAISMETVTVGPELGYTLGTYI